MKEFPKAYEAKEYEDSVYRQWESGDFFEPHGKGDPFCIIMPPPNANGSLHIGHAVFVTLQDIMTRYHRMKGDTTLWLPGADHAGFETQVVYDKKLEKEGRNRFHMERDVLWKEIFDFTQSNKKVMEGQLRKLGASCDWSREKFTLDPDIIKTVYATFKRLYDDGLVYRADRSVNWCTKHQTTLSDLEVKHVEQKDPLYYIKYGPVILATVRLETKFGDTAVAVNPKDKRYKHLVGKIIDIQTLLGPAKIKVIADNYIDPKFGTGAVKVTPAHDPNDFEMWQRHKDEIPVPYPVIDRYGKMDLSRFSDNPKAARYHGLKIEEARTLMAKDMQKEGLMEKVDESYIHSVGTCYKCGRVLEPRILPQWYIAVTKKPNSGGKSLRDAAVDAVKKGDVKFVPKRMEKIFMHWMKNLRDWNISRQIVWGIQIPVRYCDSKECKYFKEPILFSNDPLHWDVSECPGCNGRNFRQDSDVFDTWFSSGQWPFATLGYPDNKDFKQFYPTAVMETGWDILLFWVTRMMMLGIYATGKVPFRTVYLHGLVRDKDRQKMSKSKGNVIDPLGVVEQFGADALRMALVIGNTPGNDIVISEEKIKGYRNFANKIWNISRFVMMNLDDVEYGDSFKSKTAREKEILKELKAVIKKATKAIDQFRFYEAAEDIYHYVWHNFADVIIEEQKARLQGDEREQAQKLLVYVLSHCLKLLHPFMPFVTEAVWEHMPIKDKKMLIVEIWPE